MDEQEYEKPRIVLCRDAISEVYTLVDVTGPIEIESEEVQLLFGTDGL